MLVRREPDRRRDPLWWHRRTRRIRRPRAVLAVVGAASNQVAGTAVTATRTTTAGNLLVVFAKGGGSSTATFTISDSTGTQSYTQTASGYSTNGTDRSGMFYFPASASVTSVTATWSGASATIMIIVFEISGAASSSVEDASVNNTQASGTTATSGSLTTSNAADILIFGMGVGVSVSSITAGAGYTVPAGATTLRSGMEYKVVSSTQSGVTTTLTWLTAAINCNIFAAFKAAASFVPDDDSWPIPIPAPVDPVVRVW